MSSTLETIEYLQYQLKKDYPYGDCKISRNHYLKDLPELAELQNRKISEAIKILSKQVDQIIIACSPAELLPDFEPDNLNAFTIMRLQPGKRKPEIIGRSLIGIDSATIHSWLQQHFPNSLVRFQ